MTWTAVVPLKAPLDRKSRLASVLDAERRLALSEALYRHVAGCIAAAGRFEQVIVLSPNLPDPDVPATWWLQQGDEINSELARVRAAFPGHLMVVNADLPLLEPADLVALTQAAEGGACALAPDRHGLGTNAIALMPGVPFAFSFGPASLEEHLHSAPDTVRLVRRTGLAYDLDTAEDIEAVLALDRPLADSIRRCLEVQSSS